MKTFWKILVTFGVIAFFLMVVVLAVAMVSDMSSIPVIGGGNVAVIPIKGTIALGGCGGSIFGAVECASVEDIKKQLEDADEDSSVDAILLDIDSGGGFVVASRELMRAVKETKKPTVAWIGEVGASGAYYAASAADYIVADRNSITGSIGVIMTVEHYYDLMDKIGLNVTVIKAGESKDIGSPYRPMTDEEEKEFKDMVDKIYYDFVSDVAENRNMTVDEVEKISRGQIYLGSDAVELNLIDDVGSFDDALDIAGKLGGIEGKPNIKEAESNENLMDLLNRLSRNFGFGFGKSFFE